MKVLFTYSYIPIIILSGYLAYNFSGKLAIIPYILGFIGGGMMAYVMIMSDFIEYLKEMRKNVRDLSRH